MSQTLSTAIAVVGIDIGKNSFHIVCLDQRGAIVLRQKRSRGQVEVRFANMPPCLVGMEACVGAHHLNRKLTQLSALLITTVKGRQKSASPPKLSSSCVISFNARKSPEAALIASCVYATSSLVIFFVLSPSLTVISSEIAFRRAVSALTEPFAATRSGSRSR